ncbi:MAG: Hsp20/alpha crystallin family protein, partial [Mesorhizobium sp.]
MSLRKEDVFRRLPEPLFLAFCEVARSGRSVSVLIAPPVAIDRFRFRCARTCRAWQSCKVVNHRRMYMLLSDFGRIGFDPFVEMRRMQQEVNQRLAGLTASAAQEFPPINLWTGEDSVAVAAELPGISPDEIGLTVRENILTLKGTREPRTEDEKSVWHRRERAYGTFSRTVQL